MLRVLIVDDELHIRSGIRAKLEQCGDSSIAVCGEASDGQEALDWLGRHYADLCITDIRMPIMDGLELIRHINERYPWMKSVIVSSYDDFNYAKTAMALHVTEYILKPVEREMLREAVEDARGGLFRERLDRAHKIVAERLNQSHGLMQHWVDVIQTRQADKYPLLVVDTLLMMESWIQHEYYMLDSLSAAWIDMVAKQAKLTVPGCAEIIDRELGFDREGLLHEEERVYFRLAAVHRLENSVLSLFDRMKNDFGSENAKLVYQVKSYIEQHYHEKINVAELADQIPISRSYLAVRFKQGTGTTISSYLTDVRMNKAKLLLLDQQTKVYEVANRVGYENGEHFAKLFKDHWGITPKEYRRLMGMTVEV
ncbi:response regulator [Paenibacillus sp. H1-7]|uniref:response regulator transcription factor n=1 Tax=Paenibacillus sp. H1-7 TaxID=2282849 RepID=UPI001EF8EAE6|nr:response regulator [Paenibacillus sp. H1-7]ULL13460.1 response regulator [Paenibacillus sp. H1-7]